MGFMDFFSQSSSSDSSPAKMTKEQNLIYNDWFDKIYGSFDPEWFLKQNPDLLAKWNKNYKKKQITQNGDGFDIPPEALDWIEERYKENPSLTDRNDSENTTTLSDMFTNTESASASADNQYIDEMKSNIGAYDQNMMGWIDDKNNANTQYGNTSQGNVNNFLSALTQNTGNWNKNTDALMDNLRPTATQAPVKLKLGNFETPFITGAQRYAQDNFGDLNTEKMNVNNTANQTNFGTNQAQATLLNMIGNTNADNNIGYANTQLGNNSALSQMTNAAAQAHGPNAADMAYLAFLNGEVDKSEKLRYGLSGTESMATPSPFEVATGLGEAGVKLFSTLFGG